MDDDALVSVRQADSRDRDALRPIVEHYVRGRISGELLSNEVDGIVGSIGSPETWHVLAVNDAMFVGVMGLTSPCAQALRDALTKYPGEIVHAFVHRSCRGRGVGSLLARHVEARAISCGLTELIVRSGPRYRESGWRFWTALYGDPITIDRADRGDTGVWRKQF
jgi:GNAT superfamily N-acetyltransferase